VSVPTHGPRGAVRSTDGPDALLAVAHGSRDPRHPAALRVLLEAVSAARPDLVVELGFLDLCGPDVPTALARLAARGARSVVAVPLFLAHGYHVRHDIPAVLEQARRTMRRLPPVCVADALGPDPLLVGALGRRLRDTGALRADLTLVLASAGSSDTTARAEIRRTAREWGERERREVVCSYASALAPTTAEAINMLRSRGVARIAVAPYFLAPGRLPDRVLADAHAAGVPVGVPLTSPEAAPVPELVRLILARHAETAAMHSPAMSR
jgi:sirohydrochlorin ferrochelatase